MALARKPRSAADCVPMALARPDQPAWFHTVPLQTLLPDCFTNVTVKVIAEYMDVPSLLCRLVRLQLHGVSLDGFVVSEEEGAVVVLAGCGASLRIPRADLGGLVWKVDPDTNPHTLRQVGPSWVSAAVENGHLPIVDTIELHTNGRVLAPLGSIHRRVRCFEPNETKRSPFKAPQFLYMKLFFPYLALRGVDKAAAPYLREQAAHTILLPQCNPLVAPLAHYCSFHEESGSYCLITEDVTNTTDYLHPKGSDVAVLDRATGAVDSVTDKGLEKKLLRLFGTLAALHGRWLSPDGDLSPQQLLRSRRVAELSKAMVHPLVFYAEWLQAIESRTDAQLPPRRRARVKKILARLYGQPVDTDGGPAAGGEGEGASGPSAAGPSPSDSPSTAAAVGNADDIAADCNSMTLIHGHVCPAHVFMADDPRAVPTAYLVDWKRSGVGPLEVDLLQAYAQFVSRKTQKDDPELLLRLLQEYCLSLDIYYKVSRPLPQLVASMRDVAQLMLIGGPCEWTLHGELEAPLATIYQQLSDLTMPDAALLMRERLRNGGY